MFVEFEAANLKGNSRQIFQTVKSMTRKFQPVQPHLQCVQSATSENLTEGTQFADRWKGYCEDLYHDEEGKEIEVAHATRQRASCKATGPDEVLAVLFKPGGDSTVQNAQNMCGNLGNW